MDLPETSLWWSTTHQQQNTTTSEPPLQQHYHHQPTTWFNSHGDYHNNNFNLNNQNDNDNNEEVDEEVENDNDNENNNNSATTIEDEKEPMFEKPLTPSDVGKLNRLVIPKQHAEKYFPLGGNGVSTNECKGLLLSFEDESGKCWRFRYSYWNSSQSYVLTKGWSRYVKDKHLDAGDVVLFERHRIESQRLFINWRRRRTSATDPAHVSRDVRSGDNRYGKNEVGGGGGVGEGWTRGFYPAHPYPAHQFFPYQQDSLHAGRGTQQEGERQRTKQVGKNSSSSSSSSSSRVLRLFGVNMECQPEHHHDNHSGPSTPYYDNNNNNNNIPSTQGITDTHHLYHYHQQPSSNSHPYLLRHQPYYY